LNPNVNFAPDVLLTNVIVITHHKGVPRFTIFDLTDTNILGRS
jgi:hypothetical protein